MYPFYFKTVSPLRDTCTIFMITGSINFRNRESFVSITLLAIYFNKCSNFDLFSCGLSFLYYVLLADNMIFLPQRLCNRHRARPECDISWVRTTVMSNQRLSYWYLPILHLARSIKESMVSVNI